MEQVNIFLGANYVLTISDSKSAFEPVVRRIKENRGRIRKMKAGYLAYAIMDVILDYFFPVMETVGNQIESLEDKIELRGFFATSKGVKGIGYKEASHFLRNIGFKGYAILDKHVLRSLHEYGVIDNPKPPTSGKKYLEIEAKMKEFAKEIDIDFDDLDLLLWSNKTGEILK